MDNLSHSLFGAHLGRLPVFSRIPERVAFWTCIAGANVPDLDFVLRLVGEDRYIFEHRGITHSLVGLLVLGPLVALIARALTKMRIPYLPLLAVATVGVASHLLLDVLTSWGTMLLSPFSNQRFALPWIFIADPFVWLILGVPLLRTRLRRRRHALPDRILRRSSIAAITLFGCYVLICGFAWQRARHAALAAAWDEPGEKLEVLAFATPPGPLIWTTLVRTDQHEWRRYWASALTGGATYGGSFPTGATDPRVQVALEDELGSRYRHFAEALVVLEATPLRRDGSYEVVLGDLRFSNPFLSQMPMGLQLELGPDFRVRDWSFETLHVSPDPRGDER